jgi:preprotein translocase subunit SecA
VVAAGGLHILGTERHESRRIDNQLRGRAGRQGDPGSSRFYLSLQDDLLRIFGGERMQNLMLRLGMEEDVPIESRLISKRIAAAQKAVEVQNFEARKHLIEYDDVMNKQRKAVYGRRRALLEGLDQKEHVMEMVRGVLGAAIDLRCPEGSHPDTWDLSGLRNDVLSQFGHKIDIHELEGLQREALEDVINEQLAQKYQQKEDLIGADLMRQSERWIMLKVIDDQWKDHLLSIDSLKEGIGLRGYGQKDPLVEYKKESYVLFQDMMDRIEDETIRYLFFLQRSEDPMNVPHPELWEESDGEENGDGGQPEAVGVASSAASEQRQAEARAAQNSVLDFTRKIERKKEKEMAALQFVGGEASSSQQPVLAKKTAGRNDPCPCGSGKKYKKCCGS